MSTYQERRYKESRQRRRHYSRRKVKKAKITTVVLAVICIVIALVMVIVSLFTDEGMRHKWLMFGAGYAVGALALFALRWILMGYEKLMRTTRRGTPSN